MIKIRNTNNLVGITILGDYEDLSALRDALYYYTELFLSNQDHTNAYDCQQSILGLCYDIRHAYQGDRDYEAVPNNAENIAMLAECIYETDPISKESIESNREVFGHGNLYFSVDILYPWAIYYLYVLQAIIDIPCDQSWFEKLDYPYDEYRAEHDMALIQYFVQLLWGCVKTVLPPQSLQGSLGLYADFQPHRLLHFVPGLIRAVAQPLLGFQKTKQRNPHFPASDVVS